MLQNGSNMWSPLFFSSTLLALLVGAQACSSTLPEGAQHNCTLYAACRVQPSSTLTDGKARIDGHVLFRQEYPEGKLKVAFRINGFPETTPDSEPDLRGIHIHQFGDLSDGCDATGGHYNPAPVSHPNHPGDFGNFNVNGGRIVSDIESEATLFGDQSVIGRGVVVHENTDDLGQGGDDGSHRHGNAGPRLGCCVVGISTDKLWNKKSTL